MKKKQDLHDQQISTVLAALGKKEKGQHRAKSPHNRKVSAAGDHASSSDTAEHTLTAAADGVVPAGMVGAAGARPSSRGMNAAMGGSGDPDLLYDGEPDDAALLVDNAQRSKSRRGVLRKSFKRDFSFSAPSRDVQQQQQEVGALTEDSAAERAEEETADRSSGNAGVHETGSHTAAGQQQSVHHQHTQHRHIAELSDRSAGQNESGPRLGSDREAGSGSGSAAGQ
jgi:hypothetical protein